MKFGDKLVEMISVSLQCFGLLLFASVALATHLKYDISTYRTTMTSLLSNYSSKVRPIVNQGQSLQLQLSLWIAGINDVSDVDSKMTTTGYLYVRWKDELLNWDSTATGMFWMQFNQVRYACRRTNDVGYDIAWKT